MPELSKPGSKINLPRHPPFSKYFSLPLGEGIKGRGRVVEL